MNSFYFLGFIIVIKIGSRYIDRAVSIPTFAGLFLGQILINQELVEAFTLFAVILKVNSPFIKVIKARI